MFMYELFIISHNTGAIGISYTAIYYLILPVYFIVCLIADVCIGRYKVIVACIYCAFIGWICLSISFFVTHEYVQPVLDITGFLVGTVGAAGLESVTIPFNIDQLIGASADELSVVIYWHITWVSIGTCFIKIVILFPY